jgi:hypothetical protein
VFFILDFGFSIFDWELPLQMIFDVSSSISSGSAQPKTENQNPATEV